MPVQAMRLARHKAMGAASTRARLFFPLLLRPAPGAFLAFPPLSSGFDLCGQEMTGVTPGAASLLSRSAFAGQHILPVCDHAQMVGITTPAISAKMIQLHPPGHDTPQRLKNEPMRSPRFQR